MQNYRISTAKYFVSFGKKILYFKNENPIIKTKKKKTNSNKLKFNK